MSDQTPVAYCTSYKCTKTHHATKVEKPDAKKFSTFCDECGGVLLWLRRSAWKMRKLNKKRYEETKFAEGF